MILFLIVILSLLLFYYYFINPYEYFKQLNVSHANPLSILLNFSLLGLGQRNITDAVDIIYNSCQSSYIAFFVLKKRTILIKDLNLLKQVGIKDFNHFVDHMTLISEEIDPIFGKTLFCLKGQAWKNMRNTLSPLFTGKKLRSMFYIISECSENFTNNLTKILNRESPKTLELKDLFSRFANDAIASTAFGLEIDSFTDKNNEFYKTGKEITSVKGIRAIKFFLYNIFPNLMKTLRVKLFSDWSINFFREIIKNNIEIRERDGIIRSDLIQLLLEARKNTLKYNNNNFNNASVDDVNYEKNQKCQEITNDDITSQALIFFFAGFESFSGIFCHTIYELAQHENIQTKLYEEICFTMKKCEGKITFEEITKMKYLDMVVLESLRKWPSAPTTERVCTKPYVIQPESSNETPLQVNTNDAIWIPIFSIHRNPKYYPNPNKFDPERFHEDNKSEMVPFSFLPFGIGPRNCIASRFAVLKLKIAIVHILNKISFSIVEKSEIPIKINKNQLNLNAQNGFWLGLKLR